MSPASPTPGIAPALALILASFPVSFNANAAEHARLLFQAPTPELAAKTIGDKTVQPLHATGAQTTEKPPALKTSAAEAVSLPVKGQLIYEGAGHAYIGSGTLSFWWRPDTPAQKAESIVFQLSSLQRFYFCRFIHLTVINGRIAATLYSGDSAEARDDAGAIPQTASKRRLPQTKIVAQKPIPQGEWAHITVSWDMAKGFALYIDGKLVRRQESEWYYGGNVNHLALGSSSTAYSKAGAATYAQSFADVRVYDAWLDEGEVAKLAANTHTPQEQIKADIEPLLSLRSSRLGLLSSDLPSTALTSKKKEDALWLKQAGTPRAFDVKRKSHAAIDGDLGRAWPMYQGYSDSGKGLRIDLSADSRINTLQALGTGAMHISTPDAEPNDPPLLQFNAGEVTTFSALLPESLSPKTLQVTRYDGLLFNLGLYQAEHRPFPAEGSEGWAFLPFTTAADPASVHPLIPQEHPAFDQATLVVSSSKPVSGTHSQPANRLLHFVGPEATTSTGLLALALDLSLKGTEAPTGVRLSVIDPISYDRHTATVNFRLNEGGSGRLRAVLDLRDLVYQKGTRPWVILHATNDLQIDLKDSRIGFQWSPVAKAEGEFFEDQYAQINEAFQERSEGRPWAHDPAKLKLLGSLLTRIDTLLELRPADERIRGYWHWTHPSSPPPASPLPEVPTGVPGWAFHTDAAITLFQKSAHWWIDNRQNAIGEFGAPDGINDDTDLIQDWVAIDFMRGPDTKIRRSIEQVADISWHLTTVDGISKQVTDTLHIYEWGINAQTLAFVLNYGDPVYFERLLRFTSHYPDLMTECCPEHGGHLHFKSWFFGVNKIVTDGIYGRDILKNALHLQPAMLIGWYNGDAQQQETLTRWTASMIDHIKDHARTVTDRTPGLSVAIPSGENIPQNTLELAFPDAVWASWSLSRKPEFLQFAGDMVDYEVNRKPLNSILTTSSILGAYLRESGNPRWDAHWLQSADYEALSQRSIHNSNYKELNSFFAAWLRTGEESWLNKGAALALYHMQWSYPMLTEAEATTDRVWIPQRLANMTTLGGLSILRNQIYPKHAVSWQHATGRFTPLVRQSNREKLELELWSLEEKTVRVDARLWELDPGLYTVTATGEASAEEPLWEKELEFTRYSRLPLEIPASGPLKIAIKLKEKRPGLSERSDLAISHLDARWHNGELVGTIHNIGTRPSSPYRVIVTQGEAIIKEETFEPLGPPRNYFTQKHQIRIPLPQPGQADQPITLRILPEKPENEISLDNNEITVTPSALPQAHAGNP